MALAAVLPSLRQLRSFEFVEFPSDKQDTMSFHGRVFDAAPCPDAIADALPQLPALTHVALGAAGSGSHLVSALPQLPALQSLDLAALDAPFAAPLRTLTQLRCNEVKRVDSSDAVSGLAAMCSSLQRLDLPGQWTVGTIEFSALASLQFLRVLEIVDEALPTMFDESSSADGASDGDASAAAGVASHGVRAWGQLQHVTHLQIDSRDPVGSAAWVAHHVSAAIMQLTQLRALHVPRLRLYGFDDPGDDGCVPDAIRSLPALQQLSCGWQPHYPGPLCSGKCAAHLTRLHLNLMHVRDVSEWTDLGFVDNDDYGSSGIASAPHASSSSALPGDRFSAAIVCHFIILADVADDVKRIAQ